jgi:DNA-directed RNA polymerase specialized sigma24 family protein
MSKLRLHLVVTGNGPDRASEVGHEDLFIARYEQLLSWAGDMTEGDWERAEDLVQDVFIQFTLSRPALDQIENLDGYLRVCLRNLFISQIRRSSVGGRSHCAADYDSASLSLQAGRVHGGLAARDELLRVCAYAVARKEASKAASLMVLRFFHGYYPREIAQVLNSTDNGKRNTVDRWLHLARHEARSFIHDPAFIALDLDGSKTASGKTAAYHEDPDAFINDLRAMIFESCHGVCLALGELKAVYKQQLAIGAATLANLVSCAACLDRVNKLLRLPLLVDRFPTDMLKRDDVKKNGQDDDDDTNRQGGNGRGPGRLRLAAKPRNKRPSVRYLLKRGRHYLRETSEHRPRELHVWVNGRLLAAHTVSLSETNHLSLTLHADEPLAFVEIFSEQDIRLLYVPALSPLTADNSGATRLRRKAEVTLSDDRQLEVTIDFTSEHPSLDLCYRDLSLQSLGSVWLNEEAIDSLSEETRESESQIRERPEQELFASFSPERFWTSKAAPWKFWQARLWLRPVPITLLICSMALLGLFLFSRHATVSSAAAILEQAKSAEVQLAPRKGEATRSVFKVEARNSTGAPVVTRNVEVWRRTVDTKAQDNQSARRVSDANNHAVSGEMTLPDGRHTLYLPDHAPQAVLPTEGDEDLPASLVEAVRLDPSPSLFARYVSREQKRGGNISIEKANGCYRIKYESSDYSTSQTYSQSVEDRSRLLRGSITLTAPELRAVDQTLVIENSSGIHDFHFSEVSYERRESDTVPPSAFTPDAELTFGRDPDPHNVLGVDQLALADRMREATPPAVDNIVVSPVASAELEVEVLRILNAAGADAGEQVNVTRTQHGALRVEGLVETEARKRELLAALKPITHNRAVSIEVRTIADAEQTLRHSQSSRNGPAAGIVVGPTTGASNRIAADDELRTYFRHQGVVAENLDEEIRGFARLALRHSQQALLHAAALRRLANRFSPIALQNMDLAARDEWRALLARHAASARAENASLRALLSPVFHLNAPTTEVISISDDSDLRRVGEQLFVLCRENDRLVRATLTIGASGLHADAPTAQFGTRLQNIENYAKAIARER